MFDDASVVEAAPVEVPLLPGCVEPVASVSSVVVLESGSPVTVAGGAASVQAKRPMHVTVSGRCGEMWRKRGAKVFMTGTLPEYAENEKRCRP